MAGTHKLNRGGDLWRLRVRIQGKDHYRHMHGSVEQADAALQTFADELVQLGVPPAAPATPFNRWADDWLTRHSPALSARTAADYRALLDRHLLPRIGARQLARITAGDGLNMQTAMLTAGLSALTVRHALRLGRAILGEAAALRILPANPWATLRQKCRRPMPRAVLDPAQFRAIGAAVGDGDTGELIRLALASGLRRGELLALRWQDVRLAEGAIEVSGSLEQVDGTWRRKSAKTAAGHRVVALSPSALDMLRARRIRAVEAALARGAPVGLLPLFPAADGVNWANPDTVSQTAARALHRAGLADSLHGLRHAHATALLSSGINPKSVAGRLGHADVQTTIGIYGHVLPRDEVATLAALDKVLEA